MAAESDVGHLRLAHPATSKSTARGGARRFPAGMTKLLNPSVNRSDATVLLESADADEVARCGELLLFRGRQVERVPVKLGPAASWDWRGLRAARRIGSYREAPNRIGTFSVEQDGSRRGLETESSLERAHLRDLQFNRGVTWMITQPFAMRWPALDGFIWRVPDGLAYDHAGPFVFDVKPEATRTAYHDIIFDLTARTLALVGLGYRVLGEMSNQRRMNLRTVSALRWPERVSPDAVGAARRAGRTSFGGVVDSGGGGPIGRGAALHLLSRELVVDLDQPITLGAPVWWDGQH